ncbi:MAG: hypothetical protein HDR01_07805 [Lachnospiraceae bacterium]|nr:hypothetical protein [Lachnospiraceae bacterium]
MRKGYIEKNGSVTIYLALTLSVMLSLFLTLIEGARTSAIRMQTECAMDISMYSIFAEYNRELLEQYDLFFIDTSYGSGNCAMENTAEHLKEYMTDNTEQDLGIANYLTRDLLAMKVEEVQINRFTLATDDQGEVFKRQAVSYIKDKYGLSYIKELQKYMDQAADADLLDRDITEERNANQKAIDDTELPKKKIGEEEWEEIPLENPADEVNASRNKGVLALVTAKDAVLSNETIAKENYISYRKKSTGSGLLEREGCSGADELFFYGYLLDKFGTYVNPLEKSRLKYQVEYLLAGKENDMDNLKWVVNRLLLIRETANVVYLFSDETKKAAAEALALTLAAVIQLPELAKLVQVAILFAWAYAESVYDVKQLLAGRRIPLMKTDETWHFGLEGMLSYEEGLDDSKDQEEGGAIADGLSYGDYLMLLLTTVNNETKTFRAMDLIEMDIRKTVGNEAFRMDGCVDYIEAAAAISSKFGYRCDITRDYCYF